MIQLQTWARMSPEQRFLSSPEHRPGAARRAAPRQPTSFCHRIKCDFGDIIVKCVFVLLYCQQYKHREKEKYILVVRIANHHSWRASSNERDSRRAHRQAKRLSQAQLFDLGLSQNTPRPTAALSCRLSQAVATSRLQGCRARGRSICRRCGWYRR